MKSVSSNQSGTDYASLLRFELNEMGLIYQDPSLKSYQKRVEQELLEEEFDIRFNTNNPEDIQRKLLKLDKKGFERRYQARMLTSEEYRNGMELAREADGIFVPESHRNLDGVRAAGMDSFLESNVAEAHIIPGKPTPPKIEHRNETYIEKHFYKAMNVLSDVGKEIYKDVDWVVGGLLDSSKWLAEQMSKHPLIVGAVTVTGVVGLGVAADYKYNGGNTVKKVGDYSKSAGKAISGGAAGVFGGIGGLFKENQPPVADFEIKGNLTEGSPIEILDKSYDTDGRIAKTEIRVDGRVTPIPNQVLSQGEHVISLTVTDNDGKSAVKSETVAVMEKLYVFTPDIRVHGSDEYNTWIKSQLDELGKTPDFKIENMTARQYTEKYLDDLYEALPGTRENCPREAIGKQAKSCLSKSMSNAGNLLHVARHIDQEVGDLRQDFENKHTYLMEVDAVDVQSKWMAARYNWTEEKRQEWFNRVMNQYNDTKERYLKEIYEKSQNQ